MVGTLAIAITAGRLKNPEMAIPANVCKSFAIDMLTFDEHYLVT
ncbi:hypothetical protein NIES2109_11660 [Nostoc sp. HK-01]|nr:hypothetical protein NIES2109_11660 [Nostoc sp. HK-01]